MGTKDTNRHHTHRADIAPPRRSGARRAGLLAGVLALAVLATLLTWGALHVGARRPATPADARGAASAVAGHDVHAGLVESGAGEWDHLAALPTALLVSATNAPLRVLGSDGREHLEYDLIISNAFTAPLTLTAVEVIAPDGQALLRLEGDALAEATQAAFFPNEPPGSEIPVGVTVATVIDLALPLGQAPARISHRITYQLPPDTPAAALIAGRAVTGPDLTVDPRAPLMITPPLRGAGWFNANSCCDVWSAHRAFRVPVAGARYVKVEMFALDWAQLRGGQLFTGDGSQNEQYFAYGAEIVSVAEGTVVAVRDDMPDETPNQPVVAVKHPGDYAGNYVAVEIAPGVFAIYGHLQPGSVAVRVGERVTTGQRLGRLGNSGNSTAPHLHFQLSDGPDIVTSNSLPFVFDHYTLVGTVALEALVSAFLDPSAPPVTVQGPPQAQRATYPLTLTVQDFR
jgi:hypothetical protein